MAKNENEDEWGKQFEKAAKEAWEEAGKDEKDFVDWMKKRL